jgi:hypothetical protein
MEVHGINSYGKDPFISIGRRFYFIYSAKKPQAINVITLK